PCEGDSESAAICPFLMARSRLACSRWLGSITVPPATSRSYLRLGSLGSNVSGRADGPAAAPGFAAAAPGEASAAAATAAIAFPARNSRRETVILRLRSAHQQPAGDLAAHAPALGLPYP